jgi:hypothetical protein
VNIEFMLALCFTFYTDINWTKVSYQYNTKFQNPVELLFLQIAARISLLFQKEGWQECALARAHTHTHTHTLSLSLSLLHSTVCKPMWRFTYKSKKWMTMNLGLQGIFLSHRSLKYLKQLLNGHISTRFTLLWVVYLTQKNMKFNY